MKAIMRCKKLSSMGSVAGALQHCYLITWKMVLGGVMQAIKQLSLEMSLNFSGRPTAKRGDWISSVRPIE